MSVVEPAETVAFPSDSNLIVTLAPGPVVPSRVFPTHVSCISFAETGPSCAKADMQPEIATQAAVNLILLTVNSFNKVGPLKARDNTLQFALHRQNFDTDDLRAA